MAAHPTVSATVLDATPLLIPFACYWELSIFGHFRDTRHVPHHGEQQRQVRAKSAESLDSAHSDDRKEFDAASFQFPPRGSELPLGWNLPILPPMMLQLLVGRFVKHIGWERGEPSTPRLTPQVLAAHSQQKTPSKMDFVEVDSEVDVLLVRGKSTSYWEGDDGSSTRGTPDDDVYVQDDATKYVVRQSSAGLLSGGMPPPFTGDPKLLAADADALTTIMSGEPAKFRFPIGLTCLPNGLLAVCSDETRLTIINQNGFIVKRLSNIGGLRFPRGLTALGGSLLAIADGAHHRILIVDYARAKVVRELGVLGHSGNGEREFNGPSGMALVRGSPELLAVCDQLNHRVKIINWRTGVCVTTIGAPTGRGRAEGAFNSPWGVTSIPIDECFHDGNEAARVRQLGEGDAVQPPVALVVCDQDNHRLVVVTTGGVLIRNVGGAVNGGPGRDDFSRPRGVVSLGNGVVCVTDVCNHRVKVVDVRTGACLRIFSSISTSCMTGTFSGKAAAQSEALYPLGIAVLPGGDIAVGDRDNNRITVLRP